MFNGVPTSTRQPLPRPTAATRYADTSALAAQPLLAVVTSHSLGFGTVSPERWAQALQTVYAQAEGMAPTPATTLGADHSTSPATAYHHQQRQPPHNRQQRAVEPWAVLAELL